MLPAEVFDDVPVPAQEGIARLSDRTRELLELEARIAKGEQVMKELQAKARELREDTIPALMDELGVRNFTLSNGCRVKVEAFISASLAGPTKPKAIQWLRATGHESLIKRDLTVSFPKGADTEAHACLTLLRTEGYTVSDKEDVNTTSFKALVKELIAEGQPVPIEELGVYVGRKTTIDRSTEDQ